MGYLAIWWARDVSATILRNDRNFINSKVQSSIFGGGFFVTWVYGDPDCSTRSLNWETLQHIGHNRGEP